MTHHGMFVGKFDGLKAIYCLVCGFVHLDPLPTQKQLDDYYSQSFYEHDKKGWLKESKEDAGWLKTQMLQEFSLLEYAMQTGALGGANSLLDVGCGFGDFLQEAIKLGWDAVGLEPSEYACKELDKRKLPYRQGYIEQWDLCEQSADVIRAAWVLEHVLEPDKILTKLNRTLKHGGYLLLTVPHEFNALQKVLMEKKHLYFLHKSHVNYFTRESLTELLNRTGFKVVNYYATFPMEMFELQGQSYLGNPKVGQQVHGWRKRFEQSLFCSIEGAATLMRLSKLWAEANIGRDLVMLARKG